MKVYSKLEIDNWLQALDTIPGEIDTETAALSNLEAELLKNKDQLDELVTQKLSPVKEEIIRLQAQINVLKLPEEIKKFVAQHAAEKEKADKLARQVADIDSVLLPVDREIKKLEMSVRYHQKIERRKQNQEELKLKKAEYEVVHARFKYQKMQHKEMREISIELDKVYRQMCDLEREWFQLERDIDDLREKTRGWKGLGNIAYLNNRADDLRIKRQPHVLTRSQYYAKWEMAQAPVIQLKESLDARQLAYAEAVLLVGSEPATTLEILTRQLGDAILKRDNQLNEQARYEAVIAALSADIERKKMNVAALDKQLEVLRGNGYLSRMRDEPYKLYNELKTKVESNIAEYEHSHPAGQAPLVRTVLQDLAWHGRVIDENYYNYSRCNVTFVSTNVMRQRYYALTGLLWQSYRRVQDKNPDFAECLFDIFNPEIIAEADALDAYKIFRTLFSDKFYDIEPDSLFANEQTKYRNAAYYLKMVIADMPSSAAPEIKAMYESAETLLDTFNGAVSKVEKRADTDFDLKFHATLLDRTREILLNPRDQEKVKRYKELASHNKEGKPSLSQKVAGVMLMFIGAVGVAFGVGMAATTWGFSAPLSIGCISGGTSVASSGMGLFYHGREQRQEKALNAYTRSLVMPA